jgi:radical SAM protein with 4Fe4S-binding SPASM domain
MAGELRKAANLFLIGYSYIKSTLSEETTINGMPVSVSAELTNHCNLSCTECPSGSGAMSRERGFMDIALYHKIIDELSPYIYNLNLYFQGEPMLHPHFSSFIEKGVDFYTVLSTNGHFLTAENSKRLALSGLKKLIISLDGMDQDTYSAYRVNGTLDTVLEGIRNISDAKRMYNSHLNIEIQFLVNKLNEEQIPQVRRFAAAIKASLKLKSMQIINPGNMNRWLPPSEGYRRYEFREGGFVIKSSLPDRCPRLWFNPVITWDGKVVPCCFDKDAEYVMGDLTRNSFREIWNGQEYRAFRKSLLAGRHKISLCRNCTSGLNRVKF